MNNLNDVLMDWTEYLREIEHFSGNNYDPDREYNMGRIYMLKKCIVDLKHYMLDETTR